MKIALIAHGKLPIPPEQYGAVEGTVFQHAVRLRDRGHAVDIVNTRRVDDIIDTVNEGGYDFVNCHNEEWTAALNAGLRQPWVLSSHHGMQHVYSQRPEIPPGNPLFDSLSTPGNFVLSEAARDLYVRSGYAGFLAVHENAVPVEGFRYADAGNGRAICLGRVCGRKRQAWLARAVRGRVCVDFVGPWQTSQAPDFADNETARYLGSWPKATVCQRLTEYSCLVLVSSSEGAPMVVLEALAAGLSVVVSEASAANLTDEPFITVVRQSDDYGAAVAAAVASAIEGNHRYRPAIRAYASERFGYDRAIDRYLELIDGFRRWVA